MPEEFANFAQSEIVSAIDGVTTSITVFDKTTFPTQGNFRIVVDNEIMLVTAISGSTFTVIRGFEGSIPTVHVQGATARHCLTAGALIAAVRDGVQASVKFGTPQNRPSPAEPLSYLYLPTGGIGFDVDVGAHGCRKSVRGLFCLALA